MCGFRSSADNDVAYQSFEDLEVWKRACKLAVSAYDLTKDWRDYGLKNQMERCSVSIASNIAEGLKRGGKDFIRFRRTASGSAAELRSQPYIARKIGLIEETLFLKLLSEAKGT